MPVGHGDVWSVGGALYQWARVTCGQWEGHCASGSGSHVVSGRSTVPVGQCHMVSGRSTVPLGQGHLWSVGGAQRQWARVTCCGQWEGHCASGQGSPVVRGRGNVPVGQCHIWSVGGALYQWARVKCGQWEGQCASGHG